MNKNAGWRIDGTFDCDQTHDCPFIKHYGAAAEAERDILKARVEELEAYQKKLKNSIGFLVDLHQRNGSIWEWDKYRNLDGWVHK